MLTKHQLAQRRAGIGSSECGIAAGVSPFQSLLDLFNTKVFGIEQTETPAMRAGSFFEDGVASMYALELGGGLVRDPDVKLRRCRTRRHPKHRFMLATIDREVYRHGVREKLAEIKIPANRYFYNPATGERELAWGYAPDEIPAYVACQVQWQLACVGEQRCDVVAYFLDKKELAIYPQERNETLIEALIELNRRFWYDHVVPQIPPTIDGSAAASTTLRRMFPTNTTGLSPAPAHAGRLAHDYELARRRLVEAEYDVEQAGNQLKNLIGHGSGIVGAWGKATWSSDSRGRIDYKKLAGQLRTRVELLAQALGDESAIAIELGRDLDDLENSCRQEPARPLRVTYKWPLELAQDEAKGAA